jgi:hypothetical protein
VAWREGDLLALWTDGFNAQLNLDRACLKLFGEPQALANRLLENACRRARRRRHRAVAKGTRPP